MPQTYEIPSDAKILGTYQSVSLAWFKSFEDFNAQKNPIKVSERHTKDRERLLKLIHSDKFEKEWELKEAKSQFMPESYYQKRS